MNVKTSEMLHDAPPDCDAETMCEAFQITAARFADRPALRASDGRLELSFGQYAERVRRLATSLHAAGIGRGDTVASLLVNRPEFHLIDTAAIHLGATPFSVYNSLGAEQISYLFQNADSRIVFTEPQYLNKILAARTPQLERIVLVEGEHPDAMPLA